MLCPPFWTLVSLWPRTGTCTSSTMEASTTPSSSSLVTWSGMRVRGCSMDDQNYLLENILTICSFITNHHIYGTITKLRYGDISNQRLMTLEFLSGLKKYMNNHLYFLVGWKPSRNSDNSGGNKKSSIHSDWFVNTPSDTKSSCDSLQYLFIKIHI